MPARILSFMSCLCGITNVSQTCTKSIAILAISPACSKPLRFGMPDTTISEGRQKGGKIVSFYSRSVMHAQPFDSECLTVLTTHYR